MEVLQVMEKNRITNFGSGSILAISSIVSRFIGMLYKIPMTNIIGDKGWDTTVLHI